MSLLRRLAILTVFIFVANQLYLYGISDINSQALWKGYKSPFHEYHPEFLRSDTLVVQSQALSAVLPSLSEDKAISALSQNPANGGAATHLMSLFEAQGRDDEADQVAELASRLWPSHTYTRSNLADYWMRRNRPDKQIQEWNVLLTRDRSFREKLFPLLLEVIEREDLFQLILPFLNKPPVWWNTFFKYLSVKLDLLKLESLYRLRVASLVPLSSSEKNSYIHRLIRENLWSEAHDTWFLGLTPTQMSFSGLIYDGGFEGEIFNQRFGWRLSRSKNPKIKQDVTYGIKGRKALQVTLRKQSPINFKHVSQILMLPAGSYELALRYRLDTLKTTKGLSWRIRCTQGVKELLGESKSLSGSNPWTALTMEFVVPESCSVQILRLEATSRYRHDHYFQGSAWFDDLVINNVDFTDTVK